MKVSRLILPAAAAALLTGGLVAPAQAVTEHCDSSLFPNKVESDGQSTSLPTDLEPGTEVCIKAGTKTVIVTVAEDGTITQGTIQNKPKNAYLGISYYAYGDEAEPPCEYPEDCDGGGGDTGS